MSKILKNCALFLDLDGTLVDIAASPDEIVVPRELPLFLGRLTIGLSGALAIVSGRTIREIDRFLHPLRPVAAGVHGAELRAFPCGEETSTVEPLDGSVLKRVMMLRSIDDRIIIEPKRFSVAVHYRNAEHLRWKIEELLRKALAHSQGNLILCHGRKVIEVVPRQISKGAALASLMELPVFRGRIPIMIGDDRSDESAFDTAARLGGVCRRVAGEHFGPHTAEFANPAHVRAWLGSLCERVEA